MPTLIWIIILLYLNKNVALLHYVMYTFTTDTSAHVCEAFVSNAPSQEVGHWI